MTELKIANNGLFKAVFRGITKFSDVAKIDLSKKGIRIRSVDPHDFCYLDISLKPAFFDKFNYKNKEFSREVKISKLKQLTSMITKNKLIYINIENKNIELNFMNSNKTKYSLDWCNDKQFDFPDPHKLEYDVEFTIKSNEFLEIINEALAVSKEISFNVKNSIISVKANEDDFSYNEIINIKQSTLKNSKNKISNKNIESWTIIDYLKTLSELIALCEKVKISFGNNTPIRIDPKYRRIGEFTFIISNQIITESELKLKKERKAAQKNDSNDGKPLQISVTKLPKFLEGLKNGVLLKKLRNSRYETENGDYTRISKMLNFVKIKDGSVYLTNDGQDFIGTMKKQSAKNKLNQRLKNNIPEYADLLKLISKKPQNFGTIVQNLKGNNFNENAKTEIMLLLGLATWCNVLDRKLGLYYFEK